MIIALNHITINTNDYETSKKFYEEALGYQYVNSIRMSDHTLHYFQLPSGIRLEVIEYDFPTKLTNCDSTTKGIYRHFAVYVDNIAQLATQINNFNPEYIIMQPTLIKKLNCIAMLVRDPNGCEMEFTQSI